MHDIPEYRLSREGTIERRWPSHAFFDDAFVSGDIGLAKPDPAIYRFAAGRLGVGPAGCLMIDDQARNIEGARTAGLRTHFFEHARLPDLRARLAADGALG